MNRSDSLIVYPEGLLDIPAAAKWLNIPEGWLRKKVTAREVPHTRLGKHVRFSADHLAAIVTEDEVQVWQYEAPERPRLRSVS